MMSLCVNLQALATDNMDVSESYRAFSDNDLAHNLTDAISPSRRRDDLAEGFTNVDQALDQWRLMTGDLAPDETVMLTVRSGSMNPLMPVGSRIRVRPIDGARCRIGDVVVFRERNRLVAHRLLFGRGRRPGGWFLQRGDGVSPTGWLRAGRLLGLVTAEIGPDDKRRPLDTSDARIDATRQARRSLNRVVIEAIKSPARKVKRWLLRGNTDSE